MADRATTACYLISQRSLFPWRILSVGEVLIIQFFGGRTVSDEPLITSTLRSGSAIVASLLFACALIGAIFLSVWYIDNASIDVPYSDTWGHLKMVEHFLAGHLTFDDIFRPHNQNRPVLLNVVLFLGAKYDHLNFESIEYLSVIFIMTTISLLLYFSWPLFKGRAVGFFLVFSCISLLLFSLAQWENLLLPINFVFFSTITFSVGSILLMNHHLSRPVSHVLSVDLAAATLLSELALFSMGGGALIWAVNLVQIVLSRALHRRRVGLVIFVYGGVGLISLAIYLHDLGASVKFDFLFSHPAQFLKFVLIGLGNSVVGYFNNAPLLQAALATGLVLFPVYCVVSVTYFRLPTSDQKQTLGIFCLLLLGIAEELLIGLGRLSLG